ncbi:uncharacterized protein LOC110853568 [Folsomia candida]|nr:uncharacterized protein LOC110853568 [Folsomia candida]
MISKKCLLVTPTLLVFAIFLLRPVVGMVRWGRKSPVDRHTIFNEVPLRNMSCYICVGDLHPDAGTILQRCSVFRKTWKKFKEAKGDYNKELAYILKDKFTENCEEGVEDCYYSRPYDTRIVGFEERGCGSGPDILDAEPSEGCTFETLKFLGEEMLVTNCVCDNKKYCNGAPRRQGGGKW